MWTYIPSYDRKKFMWDWNSIFYRSWDMFNWGPECYFLIDYLCVASMRIIFPLYLGHMKCGEWVFCVRV